MVKKNDPILSSGNKNVLPCVIHVGYNADNQALIFKIQSSDSMLSLQLSEQSLFLDLFYT